MFVFAFLAAFCTVAVILNIVYFADIWSLILIIADTVCAIWALSRLFKNTLYCISLTFYRRSLQDVQRAADEIVAKAKIKAISFDIMKYSDLDVRLLVFKFSSRKEADQAADNSILREIYCKWATPEGAKPEEIKEG